MPAKRYPQRHAKPGQLLVYYGKLPHSDPDICYAWGGDGASKYDGNFLSHVLGSPRCKPAVSEDEVRRAGRRGYVFECSILEELDARGYDLATLKFSIQKKEHL